MVGRLILFILFPIMVYSQTLSFPWAVGHGKNTTGGRGYGLFFVTNLNDSGTGSFRQALLDADTAGGGNIIFRVAGTITITTDLQILGDNISIWGMSAPGGGICIYGDETFIKGQNFIMTDLRFRPGDPNAGQNEDGFNIQLQSSTGIFSNYMIDHCSFSWSSDENFSIATGLSGNATVNNVTVQNSIFSEGFDARNILLWGYGMTDLSFIGNYLANTQQRNIRASVAGNVSWEQINNFVYNYGIAVNPSNRHNVDVIGNVFEDGPATQLVSTIDFSDCSTSNCPPSGDTDYTGTALYHTDNTFNGGAISVSSNVSAYITGTPNLSSGYTPLSSSVVKDSIFANAGARAWVDGVDTLDAHIIADGLNGTIGSWPSNEAATIGLPTLSAGTPYTDTDNDGMDDSWETARGLNVGVNDSNGDDDLDGYTNMEEFMHYRVGKGDEGGSEPGPFSIPKSKLTKKKLIKTGF
tara:strand:+ start:2117 stop:3517 length:1401 start_codon:yes stop_codon:yes gene_type:complete